MVRSLALSIVTAGALAFAWSGYSFASSFVADDTYAAIPATILKDAMIHVSAHFSSKTPILFAELRTVKLGICGLVNASLDYKGYVPFFFDSKSSVVKLGKEGKLQESSAAAQIKQCR
jgi:hypothetical protein